MRVYKDFYVEDMLNLLENASNNGHISVECVSSDLASELYDYVSEFYMDDVEEDKIYDFIRFDMEIQTEEEIKENYSHLIDEDDKNIDIEDLLSYHTTYIGEYESNGTTYYVFTSF